MNKSHTKEGQDIINGNLLNLTTRLCFKKKKLTEHKALNLPVSRFSSRVFNFAIFSKSQNSLNLILAKLSDNKVYYYINCSVLQGFLPPRNVVSEHT